MKTFSDTQGSREGVTFFQVLSWVSSLAFYLQSLVSVDMNVIIKESIKLLYVKRHTLHGWDIEKTDFLMLYFYL